LREVIRGRGPLAVPQGSLGRPGEPGVDILQVAVDCAREGLDLWDEGQNDGVVEVHKLAAREGNQRKGLRGILVALVESVLGLRSVRHKELPTIGKHSGVLILGGAILLDHGDRDDPAKKGEGGGGVMCLVGWVRLER
jgi:hypothetical protein